MRLHDGSEVFLNDVLSENTSSISMTSENLGVKEYTHWPISTNPHEMSGCSPWIYELKAVVNSDRAQTTNGHNFDVIAFVTSWLF